EQLLVLEAERFAIDHNALTLMLLNDWGLPGFFIDALSQSFKNEVDEQSRTARFARQIIFARMLGEYCLADPTYRAMLLPDLENEGSHHGLEKIGLLKFIDEVIYTWHEWGKLINIKTDVSLSLTDLTKYSMPVAVGSGLDLLLVDDDPLMTVRLSKQLQEAGHRVAICRDGDSALKYVFEHNPQMVITDWHMKPIDGLTLCKALRASPLWENVYIIMLTATESEDALVEAFDAGIDDYVTKPVSLRVLLARIRAGQRLVLSQQEIDTERREIQRYIRELAVANRRLEMMANTDILTNLPNRRYALSRLAQEWLTAQRYKRPLSVLMLDLDYFKSVNDSLGHEAGDQVLAQAAKTIREASRTSDIACRLGGEEFLVIATNTDGGTALLLAERIRKAIEKNQPSGLALPHPVTVSIGVAGAVDDKISWNDLIKKADMALYKAKQGGRNTVRLAAV
ncbi:MAG: diguanylate cyclase, partial [Methylococcales bacterium]